MMTSRTRPISRAEGLNKWQSVVRKTDIGQRIILDSNAPPYRDPNPSASIIRPFGMFITHQPSSSSEASSINIYRDISCRSHVSSFVFASRQYGWTFGANIQHACMHVYYLQIDGVGRSDIMLWKRSRKTLKSIVSSRFEIKS